MGIITPTIGRETPQGGKTVNPTARITINFEGTNPSRVRYTLVSPVNFGFPATILDLTAGAQFDVKSSIDITADYASAQSIINSTYAFVYIDGSTGDRIIDLLDSQAGLYGGCPTGDAMNLQGQSFASIPANSRITVDMESEGGNGRQFCSFSGSMVFDVFINSGEIEQIRNTGDQGAFSISVQVF